jgi:hypothetical protein
MSWLTAEKGRIEEESKRRLAESDIKPALTLGEGVTTVAIDLKDEPRTVKTKFGNRKVVNLITPKTKDNETMCLMMSDYLYEQFIKAVADKSGIVKVNIVRMGAGKETKYKVSMA